MGALLFSHFDHHVYLRQPVSIGEADFNPNRAVFIKSALVKQRVRVFIGFVVKAHVIYCPAPASPE